MRWLEREWWQGLDRMIAVQAGPDRFTAWKVVRKGGRTEGSDLFHFSDAGSLRDWLKKCGNWPIIVLLNPDFAIHRLVQAGEEQLTPASVIGMQADDPDMFCLQAIPAWGGQQYASVARMTATEDAKALLGEHASRVISCVLSPVAWYWLLAALRPDFASANFRVTLGGETHWTRQGLYATPEQMEGQDFVPITTRDFELELKTTPESIPFFSAAASVWMNAGGKHSSLTQTDQNFRLGSALRKGSYVFVVCLVLVAGVTAVFRMNGNREKQKLEQLYMSGRSVTSEIDSLRNQVVARASMVNTLGGKTLRASRVSEFMDRLGQLVPQEVELVQLTWSPDEDDLKKMRLEGGEWDVLLRGTSGDSWPVSRFSAALESAPWVQSVNVMKSEMNFRTGFHEFTLALKLHVAG